MPSKLSRFCDALIEAGWLTALVTVPLYFDVYSSRVFEPDKISLLRAIVFVMLGAWLVKQVDTATAQEVNASPAAFGRRLREAARIPLVLPVLLLMLAYLISTAFSLAPRISLWGSYQRLQGALTYFSYLVVFFLLLSHLRKPEQLYRLLYAIILTSLPISLYGVWQRLGQDPLPWGGDVTRRVAANMGNPIFVSAYLIMAFFPTLERLTDAFARMWNVEEGNVGDAILAGCLLFILIVQLVTSIFLSQSRGPFLGWLAGVYVFTLLGLIAFGRWAWATERVPARVRALLRWVWATPILLAVLLGGFLILFNLPNSPLAALRQESGLGRLGTMLDLETGTNRVRTLIWQGAVRMIAPHPPLAYPDGTVDRFNVLRPLIGYGPEAMWVAYNPFYPPDLAHLEARNASPDRAHNETFDALITTGLFGFLAYFALFTSIFYYSLRWLGFIRSPGDRALFLALGGAGALLGVVAPLLLDGSLRLAGVGLPFGFILGVVLYVTIVALQASRRTEATPLREGELRRQLLIIALLSTMVAHFVEIHFGIAIVATRLHFWALSALLVVVGSGRLGEEIDPVGARAPTASPATTLPSSARARRRARREGVAAPTAPPRDLSAWAVTWPWAALGAVVFIVLAFDYITNPVRDPSAWEVFLRSLTTRYLASRGERVPGVGVFWLLAFTWLVGGMLAAGMVGRFSARWSAPRAARAFALFATVSAGAFLVFGLLHASRLAAIVPPGGDALGHVASYVTVFTLAVLAALTLIAAAIYRLQLASASPERAPALASWASLPASAAAIALVAWLIATISIRPIQADILYKQGQAFEGQKMWGESVAIYKRALELTPQEDYYLLFLGRAQLELARQTQDAVLRQNLLNQALTTLVAAQAQNPLNTDHTANLARLYRNWGELTADAGERERLWQQSLAYYEKATRLSPNAAHLYNEWGLVHFMLADLYQRQGQAERAEEQWQLARARYDRSLALDQEFAQTYLLLGDLYRTRGDMAGAAEAYRKALDLEPDQPQVWSALGYVYAQLGRLDDAIAANQQVLAYAPRDPNSRRNLALLYQQAGRLTEALAEARLAREVAPAAEQAELDAFIAQLESQLAQP